MDTVLGPMLLTGLGIGMLHALDPDHMAAVAGVSAPSLSGNKHERGIRVALRFSLHWAFGHGAALIVISAAVLILGMAMPQNLSYWAERAVGFMLIVIGLAGFLSIYRQWNSPTLVDRSTIATPFIGLLHGIAGSAPLLALLPITRLEHPLLGMAYVVLFSLGVAAGMVTLASFVGVLAQQSITHRPYGIILLQACMVGFSLLLGLALVIGVL